MKLHFNKNGDREPSQDAAAAAAAHEFTATIKPPQTHKHRQNKTTEEEEEGDEDGETTAAAETEERKMKPSGETETSMLARRLVVCRVLNKKIDLFQDFNVKLTLTEKSC